VQLYETDASLLDAVAGFIGAALRAGDAGIVVATRPHREGLQERLRAQGLDMGDGRYVALDATETLSRFMGDGMPDPARFAEVVGGIVERAAVGGRKVRVFGEMVALLVADGNQAAAVRLEELWNDLLETLSFSLFCAYPMEGLVGAPFAELVDDVCTRHSRVIPAESYTALLSPDDRLRAVAVLQQKAASLEAEIADQQAERLRALNAAQLRASEEIEAGRDAARRLSAIVESSNDAIIGKTLEGIVTSWNRAAEQLYGYRAEEMVGESVARIIPPDRPDELHKILARLRRGERIEHYETVRRHKDGSLVDVSVTVSPVMDTKGRVVGASAIARDVSERRRAEAERARLLQSEQAARGVAEAALRARDEFLAAAAHDLKTPLTTIKGTAQLLQWHLAQTRVNAERVTRGLGSIDATASRMAAQIDELLDLTQVQMGEALALQRQPTDLVSLAQRVTAEQQQSTQRHSIRVEAAVEELVGTWDVTRLARALDNLLGNAVKYSPQGGEIVVTVRHEEDAAGRWAVLEVRDPGVGIPETDLPRIFERFHRAGNVAGEIGGSGIGLTSARQVVEQHGGCIAVATREGEGSTFTVRLPLTPSTGQRGSSELQRMT
jgi:PAS domain S-box-containing protein